MNILFQMDFFKLCMAYFRCFKSLIAIKYQKVWSKSACLIQSSQEALKIKTDLRQLSEIENSETFSQNMHQKSMSRLIVIFVGNYKIYSGKKEKTTGTRIRKELLAGIFFLRKCTSQV